MSDQQKNLFDDEPAPWEADDRAERLVAAVVFPDGPGGEFDYAVPDLLRAALTLGCRVKVPLGRGNRPSSGYCVRLESRTTHRRLKPIQQVVDAKSLLSPAMLRLTEWIAEEYLCPWAQVLDAVVPAGVRHAAGTRQTTVLSVAPEAQGRLDKLDLPPKQLAILRALAAAGRPLTPGQLAKAAGCTTAPIMALRRKALLLAQTDRVSNDRTEADAAPARESHLTLNPDQRKALDAILAAVNSGKSRTLLMHGVTGSGKTEVYIQAIQEVIHFGRQAIVLVPEISLTPQTLARFRSRFDRVAVLHSHLTDAERHGHWQRIAQGQVQVVVGARSAIFAPTPHLGLIVLDEEHESTFKQETAPRYHAREVAIARAEAEKIPLVLGSATPSLESWRHARTGRFELLSMPRRVLERPLPAVGTIDLRDRGHSRQSRGSISRPLHAAMRQALDDGGQVILLLNRRGFSTQIQCPACGHVVVCPECEIALTHHRTEEKALCHYCDFEMPAPTECPECRFSGIRYSGLGTQRLEAEVRARFPNTACLRMDTDTMRTRGSHERALTAFREGRVQILLGTQMIAKGLDFPNVTLVGVVNADTALHLPDFRAAERTFHLVTQVAGRTGRGEKGGRVLVQTFSPEHPAIQAAVRHDYEAFAAGELPLREALGYPPFASMVRLVLRGPSETITSESAAELGRLLTAELSESGRPGRDPAERAPRLASHDAGSAGSRPGLRLGESSPGVRVLGPAPAPLAKLRGKYRFQIHIQGPDRVALREAVRRVTDAFRPPDDVQWIVDVDPVEMM